MSTGGIGGDYGLGVKPFVCNRCWRWRRRWAWLKLIDHVGDWWRKPGSSHPVHHRGWRQDIDRLRLRPHPHPGQTIFQALPSKRELRYTFDRRRRIKSDVVEKSLQIKAERDFGLAVESGPNGLWEPLSMDERGRNFRHIHE